MEHLLVKVPSEQIDFVTQLLNRLSLEVESIGSNELTDEQYESILNAQKNIRGGKSLSTDEMNEKFEKWRTK